MTALLLALMSSEAMAFECFGPPCVWWGGDSMTYRIVVADFTSGQIDEIEDAANSWDAGNPGDSNPYADWNLSRGADVVAPATGGLYDFENQLYMRDTAWFEFYGWDGVIARAQWTYGFPAPADIIFNSDVDWTIDLPSQRPASKRSIGQTALHEFGHILGLKDLYTVSYSATMLGRTTEGGGDIAERRYRIGEDDYDGLRTAKPGTSQAGVNLMLSKFQATDDGRSEEVWNNQTGIETGTKWCAKKGQSLTGNDRPAGLNLHLISTTSYNSVLVEWKLSDDITCFLGTEYLVADNNYNLTLDSPYIARGGDWLIPSNTPIGDYWLCARVDPDGMVSEIHETDNTIRSEIKFKVVSATGTCP